MICGRCSVKIDGETVIFSYGKKGTLERLYSRVCRHTIGRPSHNGHYCINPCKTYNQDEDFGEPPTWETLKEITNIANTVDS